MDKDCWEKVSLRCPHCGKKIIGYKTKDNSVKFSCPNCHSVMFSVMKGRDTYIHILPTKNN